MRRHLSGAPKLELPKEPDTAVLHIDEGKGDDTTIIASSPIPSSIEFRSRAPSRVVLESLYFGHETIPFIPQPSGGLSVTEAESFRDQYRRIYDRRISVDSLRDLMEPPPLVPENILSYAQQRQGEQQAQQRLMDQMREAIRYRDRVEGLGPQPHKIAGYEQDDYNDNVWPHIRATAQMHNMLHQTDLTATVLYFGQRRLKSMGVILRKVLPDHSSNYMSMFLPIPYSRFYCTASASCSSKAIAYSHLLESYEVYSESRYRGR